MPLNLRASAKIQKFNVPVSYRLHDKSGKFLDARNVNSIQDRLDTRFGTSRYNTQALPGKVLSVSFFTKSSGQQFCVAKVGDSLYSVSKAGEHTLIYSGLSPITVHRGFTDNDRHIIAIEGDGLFSWNGTIFSPLGQDAPSAPVITASNGGSLTNTSKYKVALTFYASSIGLESNYISRDGESSSESNEETASGTNLSLSVTGIPATASNKFVDKVYIYLKDVTANSAYLYAGEVSLGTTTFTISAPSTSMQTPPVVNGSVRPGGGKYLASFNSKTVYAGSSEFPNEVYFSEEYLPDAYNPSDEGLVIPVPGRGPVTGLAVGLFGDSVLDPFLVIFKEKSTRIYSEIGGIPKLVVLSEEIGCASHDSIQVKNGVVYFISNEGWRVIQNGRFITNNKGDAVTLAEGDIDDIFKSKGFTYEVNRQTLRRAFSVYYPTLDQYITWVSEGADYNYNKAYVYEFDLGGFKPYEFAVAATCATLGEDSAGQDQVLFGTENGFILRHSIQEKKSDVDADGTETAINAFAILPWMPDDGDFDATYNFRELILKAVVSDEPLTVKTFLNYDLTDSEEGEYDFTDPVGGFVLDEDALDEGTLGDGRSIVTARSDINRVGESLAIGFYQEEIDKNIGLVSMQIDSSKNGNRNKSNDNFDEEGGFDSDSGDYLPSVSESVQECASILQQVQALFSQFQTSVGNAIFSGWSQRFGEAWSSSGIEDTFTKIIQISYSAPLITLAASGSGTIREKGSPVSSTTLSATVTKRSDQIAKVDFYEGANLEFSDDPATNPDGGVTQYIYSTLFSDTISFSARVTDNGTSGGPTEVTSNTVTFTFVYPYYYGAGAPSLTAAQVGALSKHVITSSASVNRPFTTNNGEVYYFAYPASYGALSSILDENGFETFADWTLRTENITGLDGSPVSYRIYEFNNPVVAGSTNYTFRR